MPSLSYCNGEVVRAFAEFRDRRVGRRAKEVVREEKKERAKREVGTVLESVSPEVSFLKGIYRDAFKILSRKSASEEMLEGLEENAETMILQNAAEADKGEVEKNIRAERRGRCDAEAGGVGKARLIKFVREKYKIPHLSLFYY